MMHPRTMNMSQGRPLKLLTLFAIPLLIGNLFQQAYNLADSIIVGRFIGATALAAVGATNSISFLFFSVCNGISGGGGIVTAQYFGAGDDEKVCRAIVNSAYIMFSTSLAMGAVAFLLTPAALGLLGTPADILPDAITYMRMTCLSVPLIAVYNYAASMLRALGDSRTPLYFLVFACLLNVALDLFCVRGLGMGVFGAALATMLSQLLAGLGCLIFALRSNPYFMLSRKYRRLDWQIIRHAVRLGLPLALQWSMIAISTTALQTVVNRFGTAAVAAFTATNRIDQLTQQPFGSLGMALSTYAGQNYGAKRLDRVREGLRDGMLAMAIFSGAMFIVMQLFGPAIITAFVSDAEVVALGGRALRLTSCFYVFLGTIYMTRSTLNGVGDTLFSFINGLIEMLCRILLPMGLSLIPTVGVWAIWWTAGLTWAISALACLTRYIAWSKKRGKAA
ncbi:MAG: MATE family efflux transporter [Clostridia bacterium]|nr:MATE family efflux transporter [Clostridia bacterium]